MLGTVRGEEGVIKGDGFNLADRRDRVAEEEGIEIKMGRVVEGEMSRPARSSIVLYL